MEKKKEGGFWYSVASFIVNKRKAIFLLFGVAAIYCVVNMNKVQVNQDITSYLPDTSETSQGLTLMNEQFVTYGSARVMFSNVTYDAAEDLAEQMRGITGVTDVKFDDTADHYVGSDALMDVTFAGEEDDAVSLQAMDQISSDFADYDLSITSAVGETERSIASLNKDMSLILVLAVLIIVGVLFLTSKAYMEIPVLLLTFGVAALLNKGTNFWFGTISSVTNSIAVVLQLALAIDYAIILCDRFMEEHETMDSQSAMIVALSKAIPEISSSSLTTVSGMVAMMFMQFRIGYDMGIVLTKAIICSLVTVFMLMPGLILIFANGIDNTHHKSFVPDISGVGKFATKTKYIIPPIFLAVLLVAFWGSMKCAYIYDTSSIVSSKKSESRLAQEKIEGIFGTTNTLAVLVPNGDYEKEGRVLAQLEKLDYVDSVLGLANQEIKDGTMLTDRLKPRQFSEMTDIDIEVVRLLYSAYAYDQEEYGPIFTGVDDYGVPLMDMFLFLYDEYEQGYVALSPDLDTKLNDLYDTLHDAQLQLKGEDYSRFVLNLTLPVEGEETFAALEEIRGIVTREYPTSDVYLVGNSTSDKDLQDSFVSDNTLISVLTALFVMIILLFTFQSAGLPVLLVLTIQGSIWINFCIPYFTGGTVFFLAYLIISAIQMGATIDYAIVISSRYMVLKKQMPLEQAISETLGQAFPTIFTSGSILTCAGFLIGQIASDPTVASIGQALGRGTLVSIFLVLFVLPQILMLGDVILQKTELTVKLRRNESLPTGGVLVRGHVRGRVEGVIDAQVTGILYGNIDATIDTHGDSKALPEHPTTSEGGNQ